MRTMDRYILRRFLGAFLLWFVVLLALRVVVDLFLYMDEFAERESFAGAIQAMLTYYGCHVLAYITEMGGVIVLFAVGTTVLLMNRTNELVALLASGVSLHRVLWPMVLGVMGIIVLLLLNQELVVPRYKEQLVRAHDETEEMKAFTVRLVSDCRGTVWYAPYFDPATGRMKRPLVLLRTGDYRLAWRAFADGAQEGELDGQHGWMLDGAYLSHHQGEIAEQRKSTTERVYTRAGPGYILRAAGQDPSTARLPLTNPWAGDPTRGLIVRGERLEAAAGRGVCLIRPRFRFYEKLVRNEAKGVCEPVPRSRLIAAFVAERAVWRPGQLDREEYPHWRWRVADASCPPSWTPVSWCCAAAANTTRTCRSGSWRRCCGWKACRTRPA